MSETNGKALATVATAHAAPLPILSQDEFDRTWRMAQALAASNFFKDAKQAEQAFAKMLFGRDLGLSPTQALTAIHIVEGKPELSANLQASLVRGTPGYDYRVVEHNDDACEIVFLRHGEELGRSRFTMADAQRAGLAGRPVWKSYPRNMLFARAMSNGVAFHCPEVTGGLRVYSEGEISGEEKPPEVESTMVPLTEIPEAAPTEPAGPAEAEVVEPLDEAIAEALNAGIRSLGLKRGQVRMLLIKAGATSVPTRGDLEAVVRALSPEQGQALGEQLAELEAAAAAGAGAES